jgi:hypothetical protein
MAGRKAGFRHNEDTRAKIKAAAIINRLESHIFADAPIMDASQVNAAKTLLNKVLPDLATTTLEGGQTPLKIHVVIGGNDGNNA